MKALMNGRPYLDAGRRISTAADGRPRVVGDLGQGPTVAADASSAGWPSQRQLPMPALYGPAVADDLCVVTSVDRSGRLAGRSFLRFVGWGAGQHVTWSVSPGPAAVVAAGGDHRLDPRGHLVMPLPARRRCRIGPGDRVLVLADRSRARVLVVPTALVCELLSGHDLATPMVPSNG